MKHFRWLAAMVAATLFLAACGAMQDAGLETEILRTTAASDTLPATPENSTLAYWETETGVKDAGGFCFVVRPTLDKPGSSSTNFVVYDPYDPKTGIQYVWTLIVVTKGDTHYVFPDPLVGDELETDGYDTVIGCKVPEVPEVPEEPEEEPEWCSPGFWRNSPMAVADAIAASDPAFAMSDLYSEHFDTLTGLNQRTLDRLGLPTDPTLQQVLDYPQAYGGPAFNDVGDKLSGAHPDVNFTGERVNDSCPLSADASRRD